MKQRDGLLGHFPLFEIMGSNLGKKKDLTQAK